MSRQFLAALAVTLLLCSSNSLAQEAPLGGFIPFVGIGMTNEFKTLDEIDLGGIPFIADPSLAPGGPLLGTGGNPFFDLALLDTGAATHIITQQAFQGFDIQGNGMRGTNIQPIGGATGIINLEINDAGGIYSVGLGDRTAEGSSLGLNTSKLRGQTSFATLTAPNEWELPNILGLPMAAQHSVHIQNSNPQIFQYQGRTVRTPHVEYGELGVGGGDILRRAPLILNPGIGFVQGPQYVFNLDIEDIFTGGGDIAVHNNPASPSVIIDTSGNGAGLFLEVDLRSGERSLEDHQLLFDTGADLTVVSEITAARLGFDPVLDKPDFVLEVEGSGGVDAGIPGFYLEELNIDTVGGSFTMRHVPIAVLDVTNPNDPGNIIDGILGMHLFTGRDLVIDANPSIGGGGKGPSLYISDPKTESHQWNARTPTANWSTGTNWLAQGTPSVMWVAQVSNNSGNPETADVTSNSTVNQIIVSGNAPNAMIIDIAGGATLTTFGETRINAGGHIQIDAGGKLDTQFVNIEGGTLSGSGTLFVGTGPLRSALRNLSGRIEPGDGIGQLWIEYGDLSNGEDGTLVFEIGGLTPETEHDQIEVERFAFLAGTLEVLLVEDFMPNIGYQFTLIGAGDEVVGQFDRLLLPAEFQWSVNYLLNEVQLEVIGLGGDFELDGDVDQHDLAMWEAGYGDEYTGRNFFAWQRNLGKSSSVASAAAVPEPTTGLLALLVLVTIGVSRRSSLL